MSAHRNLELHTVALKALHLANGEVRASGTLGDGAQPAVLSLLIPGTKLITQILRHTTPIFFVDLTKKIGIILTHSHQAAIVVLAVLIF